MSANVTSPTLLSIESEPLVQLIAGAAFQNLNGVWLSLAETFVLRLAPSNLLSKRPPNYDPQATLNIVREATVVLVKAGAAALATGADAMHAVSPRGAPQPRKTETEESFLLVRRARTSLRVSLSTPEL